MAAIDYREVRNYFRALLIPSLVSVSDFAFEDRPFTSSSDMYVSESIQILNEDKQYGGDSTAMELLITYNVIHKNNQKNNRIEDIEDLRESIINVFNSLRTFQLPGSGDSVAIMSYSRRVGVDASVGARFSPIDIVVRIYKD